MRVKIVLEPGESQIEADNALQKALEHHSSGDAHDDQPFEDPAMVDLSQRVEIAHNVMYSNMIREIVEVIDKEYSDGVS